jgi:hypothetical protein
LDRPEGGRERRKEGVSEDEKKGRKKGRRIERNKRK